MSGKPKFSELPLTNRISTIAVAIPLAVFLLALIAVGAGFLWKAVLWAWS